MQALKEDFIKAWKAFVGRWRANWKRVWLAFTVFWLVTGLAIYWFDEELLDWVQTLSFGVGQEGWLAFSKWLHEYTKYEWLNLLGGLAMILFGFSQQSARWRQTGIAFLLAGLMAGAVVQTAKTLTGRPRPSAVVKGKAESGYDWQGPTVKGGLRGYPSGHSAAVWASCMVLGFRYRKWMIPAVLISALVAWSRVYGNYHWPMDVVHGSAIGAIFGWFWAGGGER